MVEKISMIFEDTFELIPIAHIIGKVRGPKKPKDIVEFPGHSPFKLQGFALGLVYRSQVEEHLNSTCSILMEFVLTGLPELSWAYEEIYFGGELRGNELSDADVRIVSIFPYKSDIPTSIERTKLMEDSSRIYDGIGLDIRKASDVIRLAETRDKRVKEIVRTNTLDFEPVISSFYDNYSFHWKIKSVFKAGIQEQNRFYLWLSTLSAKTQIDYVSMRFDLRAIATNARKEKSIRLEADGKDRKKYRRIPINHQWIV